MTELFKQTLSTVDRNVGLSHEQCKVLFDELDKMDSESAVEGFFDIIRKLTVQELEFIKGEFIDAPDVFLSEYFAIYYLGKKLKTRIIAELIQDLFRHLEYKKYPVQVELIQIITGSLKEELSLNF